MLQARGSLEELLDDLNVCLDENHLPTDECGHLKQEGWRVHSVISGYGRYLRQRKASKLGVMHEASQDYRAAPDDDPFADLRL